MITSTCLSRISSTALAALSEAGLSRTARSAHDRAFSRLPHLRKASERMRKRSALNGFACAALVNWAIAGWICLRAISISVERSVSLTSASPKLRAARTSSLVISTSFSTVQWNAARSECCVCSGRSDRCIDASSSSKEICCSRIRQRRWISSRSGLNSPAVSNRVLRASKSSFVSQISKCA